MEGITRGGKNFLIDLGVQSADIDGANFSLSGFSFTDPLNPRIRDLVTTSPAMEDVKITVANKVKFLHDDDRNINLGPDTTLLAHGIPTRYLWSLMQGRFEVGDEFGLCGHGIYLTDSIHKAAYYSVDDREIFNLRPFNNEPAIFNDPGYPVYAYVVLGEVSTGNMYTNYCRRWHARRRTGDDSDDEPDNAEDEIPRGYDSAYCPGRHRRDPSGTITDGHMSWPLGDFVQVDPEQERCCQWTRHPGSRVLKYCEWMVKNPRHIIIRYILKLRLSAA